MTATDHDPADPLGRIARLAESDMLVEPGLFEYESHWRSHYTGIAVDLTTREVRRRLAAIKRALVEAEKARAAHLALPRLDRTKAERDAISASRMYRSAKLLAERDAYAGELARRGDSTAEEESRP